MAFCGIESGIFGLFKLVPSESRRLYTAWPLSPNREALGMLTGPSKINVVPKHAKKHHSSDDEAKRHHP